MNYEISFPSFPKIQSCVTISHSYNYDIRNWLTLQITKYKNAFFPEFFFQKGLQKMFPEKKVCHGYVVFQTCMVGFA